MPGTSISVTKAAHLLDIPEVEAENLAGPGGQVSLERVRSRVGTAGLALEIARASEEVGRLPGQLKEIHASNARLQKELKESVEERRLLARDSTGAAGRRRGAVDADGAYRAHSPHREEA